MEHKIYPIQRQSFHVLSYSKKTEGLAATSPGWDEMWNEVVCLAPVEIAVKVGLGSGFSLSHCSLSKGIYHLQMSMVMAIGSLVFSFVSP